MSDLPLPKNLADSIADSQDPQRRAWLDRLPGMVGGLARSWGLELGAPFQPGGQCSWVAPARTVDGARLVLKVEWLHPGAEREADALRFWDGNGAVRLLADEILDDTVALLLERCEPGTLLSERAEPEQDDVVCALLPRLWREPPAGHEFPSLQAMCAAWADEAEQASAGQAGSTAHTGLDRGLVRAGLELFRTLPASADRHVLLATDLHAENILAAGREPWLAIDPKPHVGDPAYDPLQHMLNCDRLFSDPAGLARRLADLLELERDRLLLWLFARIVQESPGSPGPGRGGHPPGLGAVLLRLPTVSCYSRQSGWNGTGQRGTPAHSTRSVQPASSVARRFVATSCSSAIADSTSASRAVRRSASGLLVRCGRRCGTACTSSAVSPSENPSRCAALMARSRISASGG